jgi:imidazolonepropionase-like amidohydrolase
VVDEPGVGGHVVYAKVVDGTGSTPLDDGAVAVVGDEIVWVGNRRDLPPTYDTEEFAVWDLPGRTVVPGLVDGHMHISFVEARSEEELALYTPVEYRAIKAAWNCRRVLRAGVTSACDAASTFNIAVAIRDAIEAGMVEGPRLSVAGRQLTTHQGLEDSFPSWMEFPPGQAGVLVRNNDEILEAVRLQVKDGVDHIKVSGSNDAAISDAPLEGAAFRAEEFELIADESHRLGRKCTVHARTAPAVALAAKAGFDWIYHASFVDDEGIDVLAEKQIPVAPVLTLLVNMIESADTSVGASGIDAFKREVDAAARNLSRARERGVPIFAGSESGWSLVPYGEWHAKELELLVSHIGMSNLEAISAATSGASVTLPAWRHRIGLLAAGRLADLILIDGDPTKDIRVLQDKAKFDLVMKAGRPVDTHSPLPDIKRYAFERHRTFLNGRWLYDPQLGRGFLAP